jgi:hypothetical protein
MVIRASSVVRLSRHWRSGSSQPGVVRCLSSASTSNANNSNANSNSNSNSNTNGQRNLWMAAGATMAFAASAATATTIKADCEQHWENLPSFGSSSDSMAGSEKSGEGEKTNTVRLSKIPHKRSPEELSDLKDREEELQDLFKQNSILSTSKQTTKEKSFVSTKKMYFYKASQIETKKKSKFILLAGPSSETLGGDIAHLLGWDLNRMNVGSFADGETRVEIGESVRGKHVYLICSTSSNDAVMELAFMISALRRSSVKSITAVIPYFGYSRQDQQFGREPVAASDVALVSMKMECNAVSCCVVLCRVVLCCVVLSFAPCCVVFRTVSLSWKPFASQWFATIDRLSSRYGILTVFFYSMLFVGNRCTKRWESTT